MALIVMDALSSNQIDDEEEDPPKLDQWFTKPIQLLMEKRSPESDGAFLALSACCALYERYLIKLAQYSGENYEKKRNELAAGDMGISTKQFQLFWGCFRDGLQHQFQPTKKRNGYTYDWRISESHGPIPNVTEIDPKKSVIEVNPWLFAEFVRRRYDENPEFFENAKSHKPGKIVERIENQQTVDTARSTAPAPFPSSIQSPNKPTPRAQTKIRDTGHFDVGK